MMNITTLVTHYIMLMRSRNTIGILIKMLPMENEKMFTLNLLQIVTCFTIMVIRFFKK